MKITLPRIASRRPRPRTLLGIALIGISIAGTTFVISRDRQGELVYLAGQYLVAGSIITDDDVVEARMSTPFGVAGATPVAVVGKRLAEDVGPGEVISPRVIDTFTESRRVMTVSVGLTPAATVTAGARVQLWEVPEGGVPRMVATDATVIAIRAGAFGGENLIDISIDSRDEIAVVTAVGVGAALIAVAGNPDS